MEAHTEDDALHFRVPQLKDAAAIHDLVGRSKPLDLNSLYSYLLLCDHFRNTCIVAIHKSVIVGFISAYVPPEKPDTIFVWQVAVDGSMRNRSLATRMLQGLMSRKAFSGLKQLETTVTPSNKASMAFFRAFAEKLEAPFTTNPCYEAELFGDEGHEEELLVRIGPFAGT